MDGIWSFDSVHHYPTIECREKELTSTTPWDILMLRSCGHEEEPKEEIEKTWSVSQRRTKKNLCLSQVRAFHGGGGKLFSWIKAPSQLKPRVLVFSQPQFPSEPWTQVNTQGLEKPHTLLFLAFIGRGGVMGKCAPIITNSVIRPPWYLFFLAAPWGLWDLSSPSRDGTPTPYSGSVES